VLETAKRLRINTDAIHKARKDEQAAKEAFRQAYDDPMRKHGIAAKDSPVESHELLTAR
jgi:hypothetical protein